MLSFQHGAFIFEGKVCLDDVYINEVSLLEGVHYIAPTDAQVEILQPIRILLFSADINEIQNNMFKIRKDIFNPRSIRDIRKIFDHTPCVQIKFRSLLRRLRDKKKFKSMKELNPRKFSVEDLKEHLSKTDLFKTNKIVGVDMGQKTILKVRTTDWSKRRSAGLPMKRTKTVKFMGV